MVRRTTGNGAWLLSALAMLLCASCQPVEDGMECGPGTVNEGGVCIPTEEPSADVVGGDVFDEGDSIEEECPEGYLYQDGECFLATPIPSLVDLHVTTLGTDHPEDRNVQLHYPLAITVGLTHAGDPAEVDVGVVLREQSGDDFCYLGQMTVGLPGAGKEGRTTAEFFPGPTCLGDEEGRFNPGTIRQANIELIIDPQLRVSMKDSGQERQLLFSQENADAEFVKDCTPLEGAESDSCVIQQRIVESPGIDVAVSRFSLQNSVIVLEDCKFPGPDVPDGETCTNTLHQDDQGDWVYAEPHSWTSLGTVAYGTAPLDDENEAINILDEDALEISYEIKPTDADEDSWMPIYMHSPGDPAKAEEQDPTSQLITYSHNSMMTLATEFHSHALYLENDCGQNNLDTCDPDINPRDRILHGDWSEETEFEVRACIMTDTETMSGAQYEENNCGRTQVYLVRDFPDDDSPEMASWYEKMNVFWDYDVGIGNEDYVRGSVDAYVNVGVGNAASAASGECGLYAKGDKLPGGTWTLLEAKSKAYCNLNTPQCVLDASVTVADFELWSYYKDSNTWTWEMDISKSAGKDYKVCAYGVLCAYAEVEGSIGLHADATLELKPGSPNEMELSGQIKPYATSWAEAGGCIDLWVVKGGLSGKIDPLLELSMPINFDLVAQKASGETMKGSVNSTLDLVLEALDGKLYVWEKHTCGLQCYNPFKSCFYKIKYCTNSYTICSWGGLDYTKNIFSLNYSTLPGGECGVDLSSPEDAVEFEVDDCDVKEVSGWDKVVDDYAKTHDTIYPEGDQDRYELTFNDASGCGEPGGVGAYFETLPPDKDYEVDLWVRCINCPDETPDQIDCDSSDDYITSGSWRGCTDIIGASSSKWIEIHSVDCKCSDNTFLARLNVDAYDDFSYDCSDYNFEWVVEVQ